MKNYDVQNRVITAYNMDQVVWSKEDISVLGVKVAHEELLYNKKPKGLKQIFRAIFLDLFLIIFVRAF